MCYVHNKWYDISCATLYFPHNSEALVSIKREAESRCSINCHHTTYALYFITNEKITPVQEFSL